MRTTHACAAPLTAPGKDGYLPQLPHVRDGVRHPVRAHTFSAQLEEGSEGVGGRVGFDGGHGAGDGGVEAVQSLAQVPPEDLPRRRGRGGGRGRLRREAWGMQGCVCVCGLSTRTSRRRSTHVSAISRRPSTASALAVATVRVGWYGNDGDSKWASDAELPGAGGGDVLYVCSTRAGRSRSDAEENGDNEEEEEEGAPKRPVYAP